ncbi:MAG TPA: hypothetical protein VFN51_01905 [Candidatus Saccharimonadales bacterium]|nr:hypothetical protein [Candidatus Saccharimonadales bacterium]
MNEFGNYAHEYAGQAETMAEMACGFPFTYDIDRETVDSPALSVAMLDLAISDIEGRNITESGHSNWEENAGFRHGYIMKSFGDESALAITINHVTDPNKLEFDPDDLEIDIRFLIMHPFDHSRLTRAVYGVPMSHDRVICRTERNLGQKQYDFLEMLSRVDPADMETLDLEAAQVSLSVESTMLENGEDPDEDEHIKAFRLNNVTYRLLSDSMRRLIQVEEMKKAVGIDSERLVGLEEVSRISELFSSI